MVDGKPRDIVCYKSNKNVCKFLFVPFSFLWLYSHHRPRGWYGAGVLPHQRVAIPARRNNTAISSFIVGRQLWETFFFLVLFTMMPCMISIVWTNSCNQFNAETFFPKPEISKCSKRCVNSALQRQSTKAGLNVFLFL